MPRETSKNETSMRLLYVGFEEVVRYTVLRFINELILVVNVSEILCSTTEGISTPCYNIYIYIYYIYIYIYSSCMHIAIQVSSRALHSQVFLDQQINTLTLEASTRNVLSDNKLFEFFYFLLSCSTNIRRLEWINIQIEKLHGVFHCWFTLTI